jgi:aminomethyltransferase
MDGELMGDESIQDLAKTPLFDLHEALGARMVPFAGYAMPVSYPLGVMKEHQHTRAAAGLFDVSHMGQVRLTAKSGDMDEACLALERIVPVSVQGLGEGRQRYAMFTNASGGIIDDLMVARREDHLFLVINASRKSVDLDHMRANLGADCDIEEITDRALVALQGPQAEAALAAIAPGVAGMAFMDVADFDTDFGTLTVSRSGYTGEDGYEISVAADQAQGLAERLLSDERVQAIGLGARDSLRLEAGLCLYGNDIDTTTTPVEAQI